MLDELKRLNKLVPSEKSYQQELLRIRLEKIKEIRHAIKGLIATQTAEEAYEGGKEFESFLWEEIFPKTKMFNIRFDKFLSDPKVQERIILMASVEFVPPSQFRDVVICLAVLYAYYAKIIKDGEPLFLSEAVLDYSFSKLMFMAGIFYECSLNKGKRDIARTKKSTRTKREKTDTRKSFVIAIYEHGENIAPGTTLNKVCTTIRKQFEDSRGQERPWGIIYIDLNKLKTPSLDSIE